LSHSVSSRSLKTKTFYTPGMSQQHNSLWQTGVLLLCKCAKNPIKQGRVCPQGGGFGRTWDIRTSWPGPVRYMLGVTVHRMPA